MKTQKNEINCRSFLKNSTSFTDILSKYKSFDISAYCASVTGRQVEKTLAKRGNFDEHDYLALLSPAASNHIEQMAARARDITRTQFGNAVLLFTPLYVSNICDNVCPYCSFARQHKIKRSHLTIDEIKREAEHIAAAGMRHILVLTGESRARTPTRYIRECVSILKETFASIAIEVYPLDESEYAEMVSAGADGLTIYQETYDENVYAGLHAGGPKEDFEYRLLAPERAGRAGFRAITVGPLLGLAPPLKDVFLAGLHAKYLRGIFPSLEVSASFPRLRPLAGEFEQRFNVGDRAFVQYMTAFRLFMPSAGITVSTRESASFRNSILPLGPTKMSAGVSTSVGAGIGEATEPQFEIADGRSVKQMREDMLALGFQAVMVDWNHSMCR